MLIALLRCSSCRFAVFYFMPFAAALGGAEQLTWYWLVLGAALWFCHSLSTEVTNRLADRAADEVNRPERTSLCHRVGFGRLRSLAIGGYACVIVADAVILALRPGVALAILMVLAIGASIGYSYGPRFNRRRYLALFVLSFPFGGTFLMGWAVAHPGLDGELVPAMPFVLVGGAALGSLSGVKDITDVLGDRRIGYRSGWLAIAQRSARWLVSLLAMTPYLLLGLFVALGALPSRFLALVLLMPFALILAEAVRQAETPAESLPIREFFYHYWVLFLCLATWLYAPQSSTAILIGACVIYWTLATRYLHWTSRQPWLRAVVYRAV